MIQGFVVAAFVGLIFLHGCNFVSTESTADNPIAEASVFQQGNALYATIRLQPEYLDQLLREMDHGEPVQATYRIEFYRAQDWFFDRRLSQQVVHRRLRLRLITQRFEMTELPQKRLQYTADEDEAMSFIGFPRYIFIGSTVGLPRDHRYYLNVGFSVEHQGMSWVLGVLNRILTMSPPVIHEKIAWFQAP
ncbi:MAG: DUF4390 domain-containing protein [Magnetococcales bacterium]|nr:DUF4390 domain-containing protein [Magnetococcales bacterium]